MMNIKSSQRYKRVAEKNQIGSFTIERTENALYLTKRWLDSRLFFLLFLVLIFGLSSASFVVVSLDQGSLIFLFCPLIWIELGLIYTLIAEFSNKTTLTVTSSYLTIKHHPLPWFGQFQVTTDQIEQLYVKKSTFTRNKQHYYHLYLLTETGKRKTLFKNLSYSQFALYFEQEIEAFLNIDDTRVEGELELSPEITSVNWDGWQAFANKNGLTFTSRRYIQGMQISGVYRNNQLDLQVLRTAQRGFGGLKTKLTISKLPSASQSSGPIFTAADVTRLFSKADGKTEIKGMINSKQNGQILFYEQPKVETYDEYLKYTSDLLAELLEAYPKIVAAGGSIIPTLTRYAVRHEYFFRNLLNGNRKKNHPFRLVAMELLQDTAKDTHKIQKNLADLICHHCLMQCGAKDVAVDGMEKIRFYGCRKCGESNDLYRVKAVVAVLDTQMANEPIQVKNTLRVNWSTKQQLFDFISVEIIGASDEAVERFAVQVGNDTDPIRRPRYKNMTCTIVSNANLSQNTVRILNQTFGQVIEQ